MPQPHPPAAPEPQDPPEPPVGLEDAVPDVEGAITVEAACVVTAVVVLPESTTVNVPRYMFMLHAILNVPVFVGVNSITLSF